MDDEKINVLVVDDNRELIKIIKLYLENRGFRIFSATSASEALKILEESSEGIRIVLLDLMLPDMHGHDVLRMIREISQDIAVIVITGVRDLNTVVEVMKSGADDYITKPFRLGELEEKINNVLYKKAIERPVAPGLTAENAMEIVDKINCKKKGRILRFNFKDVEELNKFVEMLRNKKGWSISDIRIGEEMEVYVTKSEEK